MANENRSEQINIRVTPSEAKSIQASADKSGQTVTSFIIQATAQAKPNK